MYIGLTEEQEWLRRDVRAYYDELLTPETRAELARGGGVGPAMRRVPVKFNLIAMLFILFDIEVIFFFPYAVVFRQLGVAGLVEMGVFMLILLVGFIYIWKRGVFEWD